MFAMRARKSDLGLPSGYIAKIEERLAQTEAALLQALSTLHTSEAQRVRDAREPVHLLSASSEERSRELEFNEIRMAKVEYWKEYPLDTGRQQVEWMRHRLAEGDGLHNQEVAATHMAETELPHIGTNLQLGSNAIRHSAEYESPLGQHVLQTTSLTSPNVPHLHHALSLPPHTSQGSPALSSLQTRAESHVGFLVSTSSDVAPSVQFHLSKGHDASSSAFLDKCQPVLKSTVYMRGVRDIFLAHDGARKNCHMFATDFVTFAPAKDYLALPNTPLIDQEFQYLGEPKDFARFLKNETVNQVYIETTTGDLFGRWLRKPEYVRPEIPRKDTACFADNVIPGLYPLFLDGYTEYVPYQSTDPAKTGAWAASNYSNFPKGLKHGEE
ncbi:hypothetical protein E4T39_05691 [Aureobasidium subglaciale]|nr:hypothetical protein E4T39_05691 [Aureobasidium subglaciale]